MVAIPAHLGGFLCSGLLPVAPYCVPGGVRVVSISPHIRRTPSSTAARQVRPVEEGGPVRWKSDPSMKLVVISSTSTSSRLTSSSTVSVSSTTRAELRLLVSGGGSRVFTVSWDYVEAP